MELNYKFGQTWLFYAVLVDLGDAVADELSLPFDEISLEMIYRGLYHLLWLIKKVRQQTQLSILLTEKSRFRYYQTETKTQHKANCGSFSRASTRV